MKQAQENAVHHAQLQAMTPEMRQSLAILQMPLPELQAYVTQQLLENCVLEQEDEQEIDVSGEPPGGDPGVNPDTSDQAGDLDWLEYFSDGRDLGVGPPAEDERPGRTGKAEDLVRAAEATLQDYLLSQFRMASPSAGVERIGEYLIGNIDDDGYLRCTLEDAARSLGSRLPDLEHVLRQIQTFDPPGVGAQDLRECLLLQIRTGEGIWIGPGEPGTRALAVRIVEDHLADLADGGCTKIARSLKCDVQLAQAAVDAIRCLDPKPGRGFSGQAPRYLIPDVTVQQAGDSTEISVNDASIAGLRISPLYRKMFDGGGETVDAATLNFVKERIKAARWLIECVEQRKRTLLRVTEAILRLQASFFTHGVGHLRPLTLRQVAEVVGLHESTVSRATAGKFLDTPRGVYRFKFFFHAGLEGTDGTSVSAERARKLIRDAVAAEDARRPLSDLRLSTLLEGMGVRISRRTVAKYREEMALPPSDRRKRP